MKILFLAEAVSLAHVGRPLVLARWAHGQGVDVHFATSDKGIFKTNANSFGFSTHLLHTIDENLFYSRVNQGKFFYQKKDLVAYVEEEKSLILAIKPDLIVSDFRLSAAISTKLTGKPLLNLSNSYWSPNYDCRFPAPEAGIFKYLPLGSNDFIFNLIRPFAFKFFGKELNQTREYFGLEKKKDFREMYTDGSFTAYMDLPGFVKINTLPAHHFFLGPIIWSPKTNTNKLTLNDNNNVYISMGSTGENKLLPLIIQAVLNNKMNIIISSVNNLEKKSLLEKIPVLAGRSMIEPLIRAEEILPYCKLTICHGGSGTVYQSLAKGIPVLCLPKNPDQGLVSLSVEQKNLGRFLTSKNISELNIEKKINECINNEILLINTKKFQTEIELWDTKSHWIQFLNKFKTIRKTKQIFA